MTKTEIIDGQLTLWDMMSAGQEDVSIEGAFNVHARPRITPFKVTLTTGDLTLIVAMIEDYIKGLDVIKAEDMLWQAYYRKKFKAMSEKIQTQIEYDYEKAMRDCLKKADKEKDSDIGDEAMSLLIKKAQREAEAKKARDEG